MGFILIGALRLLVVICALATIALGTFLGAEFSRRLDWEIGWGIAGGLVAGILVAAIVFGLIAVFIDTRDNLVAIRKLLEARSERGGD